MIHSISAAAAGAAVAAPPATNAKSQGAAPSAASKQDSVHLSPQAQAAAKGGDVDHDGDSH